MDKSSDESRLEQGERTGHLLGVLGGLAIAAVLIAGLVVATWGDGSARAEEETAPPADPFELEGYEFAGALGGSALPNVPSDIAVGPDGTTYVADVGANRVLAFDQDGGLIDGWGPDGSGMSAVIRGPAGLALDDAGNLYVVESSTGRVTKLDSNGRTVGGWPVFENPGMNQIRPLGLATDGAGDIYVIGAGGMRKFSPEGELLAYRDMNQARTLDIAIDSQGRTYITTSNELRILDSEGEQIASWSKQQITGQSEPSANFSSTLAIDTDDNVFVVNSPNSSGRNTRVRKLDTNGELLSEWAFDVQHMPHGSIGIFPGSPGVDPAGNLYLPDSSEQRVVKVNPNGEIVAEIRQESPGSFAEVTSLAVDQDGNLYAVDPIRERILAFMPDGEFSHGFEINQEGPPYIPPSSPDIAVGPDGRLFVANPSDSSVQEFDPTGELLSEWREMGFEDDQLLFPQAIAVDDQRRLYIIDDTTRLKIFSADGEYIGVLSESLRPMAQQLANIALVDDRIYVPVDNDAGAAVEVYDLEGNLIRTAVRFALGSENAEGLEGIPNSIAADEAGNVYLPVAVITRDPGAVAIGRFVIVGPEGEVVANAEIGPRNGMISTAVGPDGTVYVTDPLTKHILVYEPVE